VGILSGLKTKIKIIKLQWSCQHPGEKRKAGTSGRLGLL
jgi:hypothetical protein